MISFKVFISIAVLATSLINTSATSNEIEVESRLEIAKFNLNKPYSFSDLFEEYWNKKDLAAKQHVPADSPLGWTPTWKKDLENNFSKLYYELVEVTKVDPIKLLGFTSFGKRFGNFVGTAPSAQSIIFGLEEFNKEEIDKKAKELKKRWNKHSNEKERKILMEIINAAAKYLKKSILLKPEIV